MSRKMEMGMVRLSASVAMSEDVRKHPLWEKTSGQMHCYSSKGVNYTLDSLAGVAGSNPAACISTSREEVSTEHRMLNIPGIQKAINEEASGKMEKRIFEVDVLPALTESNM